MLHDNGIVEIFRVDRHETLPPPQPVTLVKKTEQPFGERTVGTTRYHQAAQVERLVDRRVEIWRDDSIDVRDIARINGGWYLIEQHDRGYDDDGIPVSWLSLERTDGGEWEGAYYAG